MILRSLVLLSLVLLSACDDAPQMNAGGRVLDGLPMTRLEGGADDLRNFRGKLVVLNVWATWCGPCRREMPGLQALADSLAKSPDRDQVAVLGLSIDESPALVREYLRRKQLDFARHIDPRGDQAHAAFDVSAVPKTLVIGRDGRILWSADGERDWGDPQVAVWLKSLL